MARPAWWVWLGLGIIALSMVLAVIQVEVAAQNLTPLCWTGFILVVDGVLARSGRSWLRNYPRELLLMAAISVPSWLLFEFYDRPRFWSSSGPELWWRYLGLPPWPWRGFGYAWSFATITPAILLLAELVEPAAERLAGRGAGGRVPRELEVALVCLGAILAGVPLLWPSPYFAADIWLAWPLLLDPINHRLGRPSVLGDLEAGRRSRPVSLLVSGVACGVLWETWNWLASARWRYTVPFLGDVRLYEMPVLGFLGFAPFALAAFALYQFLRGLLGRPVEA
ncbi:MAG: hypothetical protein A2Y78_07690 [Acidobacteria bacterium RBG_13_68_16]|nr:MAG: hypothetical protein A2Y78_07690 [Acidobacteria bacterium RBG_13_68_16]